MILLISVYKALSHSQAPRSQVAVVGQNLKTLLMKPWNNFIFVASNIIIARNWNRGP